MLSDKQIIKLQLLHKNRFGEEISKEQAVSEGIKLYRLVQLVYTPMTEDEFGTIQQQQKNINTDVEISEVFPE